MCIVGLSFQHVQVLYNIGYKRWLQLRFVFDSMSILLRYNIGYSLQRARRSTPDTPLRSREMRRAVLGLVSSRRARRRAGDKSDDRHGDGARRRPRRRLLLLLPLPAGHPHFPSVNSRTIDTRQHCPGRERAAASLMLPGEGEEVSA